MEDVNVENKCEICNRTFSRAHNLRKHIENRKTRCRQVGFVPSFICNICNLKLSCKKSLERHLGSVHKDGRNIKPKAKRSPIQCILCYAKDKISNEFKRFHTYEDHLKSEHGVDLNKTQLSFNTYKDFMAWLPRTIYCTTSGHKSKNSNYKLAYYACRRSKANIIPHRSSSSRQRKSKKVGSIKMNGTCPSRLNAKLFYDGRVEVNFVETHVGHDELDIVTSQNENQKIANTRRQILKLHEAGKAIGCEEIAHGHYKVEDCIVKKNDPICELESCIRCSKCAICIHTYKCSCISFSVKGYVCKHVHALAIYLAEKIIEANDRKLNIEHDHMYYVTAEEKNEAIADPPHDFKDDAYGENRVRFKLARAMDILNNMQMLSFKDGRVEGVIDDVLDILERVAGLQDQENTNEFMFSIN